MPIPQNIRDLIGTADLTPAWRLTTRTSYTATPVDVTDALLTAEGSAITAGADLTTAPVRQLNITTRDLGPFEITDPDLLQYRLEAGYRDRAGTAYYETVGAYFLNTQTVSDDEVVTNLASAEIQVIGRKNYKKQNSPLYYAAWNAMQETLAAHRFATYVRRALDAALPTAWDSRLGVFNTTNWTPASIDDFEYGRGADFWDAVTAVATAAERRVIPNAAGTMWISPPVTRTPGTPVATIPRAHCADYSVTHTPREQLTNVYGRYRLVTTSGTGEEFQRDEWEVVGGEWSGRARTGVVETLPGDYVPGTTSRRLAWLNSRLAALNTLVKRHTFTAPAMPWIQPEDTITVTGPTGPTNLMVTTTDFDVVAGTMTVTAREVS